MLVSPSLLPNSCVAECWLSGRPGPCSARFSVSVAARKIATLRDRRSSTKLLFKKESQCLCGDRIACGNLNYSIAQEELCSRRPSRTYRLDALPELRQSQDRVVRIKKFLEQANIKLSSVAIGARGVSGRQMLAAISAGQNRPERLAKLAHGRLWDKIPRLE